MGKEKDKTTKGAVPSEEDLRQTFDSEEGNVLHELTIPAGVTDKSVWEKAVDEEYRYGRIGLVIGLIVVFAGVIMICGGIFGQTHWTASILGAEFSDTPPGIVTLILGCLIVYMTRPKVESK